MKSISEFIWLLRRIHTAKTGAVSEAVTTADNNADTKISNFATTRIVPIENNVSTLITDVDNLENALDDEIALRNKENSNRTFIHDYQSTPPLPTGETAAVGAIWFQTVN